MRWKMIADRLRDRFQEERLRTSDGRVLAPPQEQPVDLHELLREAVEEHDDEDALDEPLSERLDSSDPAEALELIEGRWACPPVISFEWDSFGPMSSSASLCALDVGDGRSYILHVLEETRLKAIAAVEPDGAPETFAAFFYSLIAKNGTSYGVELFGSLPTRTANDRPDLIPAEVVFESYWTWMKWASENYGDDTWTSLRDEIIGELLEPDHLLRSLQTLQRLPRGGIHALAAWLQVQEEEGAQLKPEDRMLILRNYFSRAYRERKRRARKKRR